jgi:hypothetical protein
MVTPNAQYSAEITASIFDATMAKEELLEQLLIAYRPLWGAENYGNTMQVLEAVARGETPLSQVPAEAGQLVAMLAMAGFLDVTMALAKEEQKLVNRGG